MFVMERGPVKEEQHDISTNLGEAINFQLKGRSQSTSKVVLVEKRPKGSSDYTTLSK